LLDAVIFYRQPFMKIASTILTENIGKIVNVFVKMPRDFQFLYSPLRLLRLMHLILATASDDSMLEHFEVVVRIFDGRVFMNIPHPIEIFTTLDKIRVKKLHDDLTEEADSMGFALKLIDNEFSFSFPLDQGLGPENENQYSAYIADEDEEAIKAHGN